MSYMKELLFHRNEPSDIGGLDEIAAALGGEVDGRWICAPSPGCPSDDRSLVIRIDPARPDAFFIYSHEGPWHKARDYAREKLKLITPKVAPAAERSTWALGVWRETVPASGTLVETYLRARAITLPPPPVL